ncbi:peptidoglycan-recognition protein LF-like [Macrosteles quadrilineatus]|uniref:peptidoglycan-recognition protein LF-like n=1 Tax=Macrosteles quadrilineatus TaxID=74068 RepID=UPI0023E1EF28|nr:peptidoglycan-recognition protein LF-like [Macrosteles quadrilineatus]
MEYNTQMPVIPRQTWKAAHVVHRKRIHSPVTSVFFTSTNTRTCSDTDSCSDLICQLQLQHMQELPGYLADIRYNFLIGGDGRVYQGRGWTVQPTLPFRYTKFGRSSIYIAFIGGLRGDSPPPCMLDAQDNLIKYGVYNDLISAKVTEFTLRNARR